MLKGNKFFQLYLTSPSLPSGTCSPQNSFPSTFVIKGLIFNSRGEATVMPFVLWMMDLVGTKEAASRQQGVQRLMTPISPCKIWHTGDNRESVVFPQGAGSSFLQPDQRACGGPVRVLLAQAPQPWPSGLPVRASWVCSCFLLRCPSI